jgi:hypothetical protein
MPRPRAALVSEPRGMQAHQGFSPSDGGKRPLLSINCTRIASTTVTGCKEIPGDLVRPPGVALVEAGGMGGPTLVDIRTKPRRTCRYGGMQSTCTHVADNGPRARCIRVQAGACLAQADMGADGEGGRTRRFR